MPISQADRLQAHILIVDDQQANVTLLENILRQEGFRRITSTLDPCNASDLYRSNNFDLVLLDIEMPGMDGFEVMQNLIAIDTHGYVPILVVTAQPAHKLRALTSGAKDFISKPLDLIEVKTRINNMLEVRLLYRQLEKSNQALEFLALHDALTGLPNRRLLFDRLSFAIAHAHRNKNMMAVMYLDLDEFKEINDSLGHAEGDRLLVEIGARLQATVRAEDTVARMGGDEFVIVLSELTASDDIALLATKVITAVARPPILAGTGATITASVGISLYPTHGDSAEALMKVADGALYQAKQNGKNRYCIASAVA
ncbi:MAG: diguanylate cyclase [Sideroxydans sp.]|jgi:diguanylate cyclase (GGDEF)-like protein